MYAERSNDVRAVGDRELAKTTIFRYTVLSTSIERGWDTWISLEEKLQKYCEVSIQPEQE
jgi:hypothetical protein